MRKYGYLVVEGPHDVEFAYRLLSPFGMERVQYKNSLDEFLHPLIPKEFPPKNGDLQKRMPIPLFLQNETHAIAIRSATGDSQLVNVMVSSTELLTDLNAVVGIGILLDSDEQISANQRYADIQNELIKKSQQFKLHDELGKVRQGKPNFGAFVLPDNTAVGTLEDLLLESASLMYPELLFIAKEYVNAAKNITFNKNDRKDFKKPAGENKAIVGAMANIMRPSKSVQVSIQDNGWLKKDALSLPRIKSVQDFLKTLFELP
jgi:hypothetical protein